MLEESKQIFVLGPWSLEEQNDLSERITQATKFVFSFVTIGLNMTMSALNGK